MLAPLVNPGGPPLAPGRAVGASFTRIGDAGAHVVRGPAAWGAAPTAVHLEQGLGAPRAARQGVRDACRAKGLPPALEQLAVLLTSEVVTNAVQHGGGRPRMTVDAAPGGIGVAVADDDASYPLLRVVGLDAPGGRGVDLLDRLAHAWGVGTPSSDGTGKVVWFELRTT